MTPRQTWNSIFLCGGFGACVLGRRASSNVPGVGRRERPSKTPLPLHLFAGVTCGLTPPGPFVGQATQTRPGCWGRASGSPGVLLAGGKSGQDVTRQGVHGSSPLPLPSRPSPHSTSAFSSGNFPSKALQASQALAAPRPPSLSWNPEEVPHSLACWVTPHTCLPPPARHLSRTFRGPLLLPGRWECESV